MAETKKGKGAAAEESKGQGSVAAEIISQNLIGDKAVEAAMKEIAEEKDERKKRDAKRALCIATYFNRKTRLQLQQRRREDDITKEKLDGSKSLLERLIGLKCEIKDGILVPTKEKIPDGERLTPTQFESETRKFNEEIDKKFRESNHKYTEEVNELRNSYEGEWRYCLSEW